MPNNVLQFPKWFSVENKGDKKGEINVRGTIGLDKAFEDWGMEASGNVSEFEAELSALGDVSEIELNIYSSGGFVFPALAMHDVLVRHPAKIIGRVDGLCASAATILLMAADEIEIPENAYLMIHNASAGEAGDHRALQAMADKLKRWSRDIANIYTNRIEDSTGANNHAATLGKVIEMMDEETWLTGDQALEIGLADRTTPALELAATLTPIPGIHSTAVAIDLDRAPEAVRHLFDSPSGIEVSNTTTETMPEENTPAPAAADAPASTPDPEAAAPVVAEVSNEAPAVVVTDAPAAPPAQVENTAAPAPAPEPSLAEQLRNAVTEAIAPLQERIENQATEIENLQNLRASGVPTAAWGNQAPASTPHSDTEASAPIDFENTSPLNLISIGRQAQQKAG